MIDTVRRRGRRRAVERMAGRRRRVRGHGWPVCAGAHPPGRPERGAGTSRACSCDRMGCPAPGAHPMSPRVAGGGDGRSDHSRGPVAGQAGCECDPADRPGVRVLDVPAAAGTAALGLMERSGVRPGPVALSAGDRALFFVLTRGTPEDEHEWWSCHLDCEPETVTEGDGPALALQGQLRAGPALQVRPCQHRAMAARSGGASAAGRGPPARIPRRRVRGSRRMSEAPTIRRAVSPAPCAVTPGGVNSPVRAFGAVGGTPVFMASGSGAYLTDVDGREYVDLVCSWGPMILGHAHPAVTAAAAAVLPRERRSAP